MKYVISYNFFFFSDIVYWLFQYLITIYTCFMPILFNMLCSHMRLLELKYTLSFMVRFYYTINIIIFLYACLDGTISSPTVPSIKDTSITMPPNQKDNEVRRVIFNVRSVTLAQFTFQNRRQPFWWGWTDQFIFLLH